MNRAMMTTIFTIALAASANALVYRGTDGIITVPYCYYPGFGGESGTSNCSVPAQLACKNGLDSSSYNTCSGQRGFTNSWQGWANGNTCECYYW
ncbi:hypothetical protein TI39_contig4464g00001 [Zymoseptoria brevis]|uniref:Uncharacterized protein n=1 Tax=Zymoseptoria brevis TaxID=1047168 RepID=A0A0F4G9W3_9PEZI|nr:hypothetical protein TI39_contig4464g00001 [Zymoseptoria brevis]